MNFPSPLRAAVLLKRYKRFLADVQLPSGEIMTIHCANTGAMTGCAEPGDTVWYSTSDSVTRKYPCSWELTQTTQQDWICVNTLRANQLVAELLTARALPTLHEFTHWQPEVRFGEEKSRVDFCLTNPLGQHCYLEVKSVTLLEKNCGYFPDTVTLRGQKHLRELTAAVVAGQRAVLFFAVLHTGIQQLDVAEHLDPVYADLLRQAIAAGVEVLAYRAVIDSCQMVLQFPVPLRFN